MILNTYFKCERECAIKKSVGKVRKRKKILDRYLHMHNTL